MHWPSSRARILSAHQRAETYFSGSGLSGRLRFGVADDLALTPLPRILRDFRRLYPRIDLELTVAQSTGLERRAESGHLDVAFIKRDDWSYPRTAGPPGSAGVGRRGGRSARPDPTHSARGLSSAERDPFAGHSGTGPSWPKLSDHLHHSRCQWPAGRDARRARGGDLRANPHSRRPRRAAGGSPATRARGSWNWCCSPAHGPPPKRQTH